MSNEPASPCMGAISFEGLLESAQLKLDRPRKAALYSTFPMVLDLMRSLDSLDLKEATPAARFDPEWDL